MHLSDTKFSTLHNQCIKSEHGGFNLVVREIFFSKMYMKYVSIWVQMKYVAIQMICWWLVIFWYFNFILSSGNLFHTLDQKLQEPVVAHVCVRHSAGYIGHLPHVFHYSSRFDVTSCMEFFKVGTLSLCITAIMTTKMSAKHRLGQHHTVPVCIKRC